MGLTLFFNWSCKEVSSGEIINKNKSSILCWNSLDKKMMSVFLRQLTEFAYIS